MHGDACLKVVIMLCLVPITKNGDMVKIIMCLTNSQVVFLVTDLVLTCKLYMLPAHHRVKRYEPVYQLSEETLEVIQSSLENA